MADRVCADLIKNASKKELLVDTIEPLPDPMMLTVAHSQSTLHTGGYITTVDASAAVERLLGTTLDSGKNLATRINEAQAKIDLAHDRGRVCDCKLSAWQTCPAKIWSQRRCDVAKKAVCADCFAKYSVSRQSVSAFAKANLAARAATAGAPQNPSAEETAPSKPFS